MIVPVLNEEDSIEGLIEALNRQTRLPDEIVIGDGGSTDRTRALLNRLLPSTPGLRVVDGPGGISANRNAAIRASTYEIIACTDAGCAPDPNWLADLVAPFDEGADWVAGFYRPAGKTMASTAAGAVMMTTEAEVDLDNFLPGGSSQAFRKRAWERVGGFPEGSGVGEDTLFGEQLRSLGYRPVFVPSAQVAWEPPPNLAVMAGKARSWGKADGIHQVRSGAYAKVFAAYWIYPLVALLIAIWWPWLGVGLLLLFGGLVAYRTRHKYAAMNSPGRFFWIPLAHLRQQWAQSAGWISGYGWKRLLGKVWERLGGQTFAGAEEPVPARHNVDVLVRNRSEMDRWLRDLPAPYRVGVGMANPDKPVVFATLTRRRHREPLASPVRVEAEELTETDPVARFEELRQSGVAYQLVPTPGGTRHRTDPITRPQSALILSAVPLHDVGGGSRGAQIAQQLATQGVHVTYVYRFDAAESIDLGLRVLHPAIEERRWDEFDLDAYLDRLGESSRMVLVELPHPDFLPIVDVVKQNGFLVVYDLIDDWSDPALGSSWFRPSIESALVDRADCLVASARALQESLAARSERPVLLLPNAVNVRLFDPAATWSRPADLPDGPIFEYHGSLYGDWFDWEAVSEVAEAFPEATVVLIGDRPRVIPATLPNVILPGLKQQSGLAAYLAHTEVALIPFVVSPTTHAVSPLKVYEYLAMGIPVAAPPLEPLLSLSGVFTDTDLVEAVRRARRATPPDPTLVRRVHSWRARMEALFHELGWTAQPEDNPVELRTVPIVRFTPEEQRL